MSVLTQYLQTFCALQEVISRQSSNSKASYEDSLSGFSSGSRKVGLKSPALRNIVEMAKKKNSVIINSEARGVVSSEASDGGQQTGLLSRISAKMSRTSAPAMARDKETGDTEDVIKFRLVEDIRLVTVPITSCLLVLLTYLVLGAMVFAHWEDWTYLDGAYFCFISLMTIGFGDFVPGKSYIYNFDETIPESEANAKLVLGAVYILLGMGIIAMCVNLMQEKIITEVRRLVRSLGLIREYHDVDGEEI